MASWPNKVPVDEKLVEPWVWEKDVLVQVAVKWRSNVSSDGVHLAVPMFIEPVR